MTEKVAVGTAGNDRPGETPEEHEDLVLAAPRSHGPRPRAWNTAPVGYPWEPEDAPEVATLEETVLRALEARLADVRRLLLSAARIRSPLRAEVVALAELSRELHRRVLEDLDRPTPNGRSLR